MFQEQITHHAKNQDVKLNEKRTSNRYYHYHTNRNVRFILTKKLQYNYDKNVSQAITNTRGANEIKSRGKKASAKVEDIKKEVQGMLELKNTIIKIKNSIV